MEDQIMLAMGVDQENPVEDVANTPEKNTEVANPAETPAAEAFISEWFSKIDKAEKFHEDPFKDMLADQQFAAGKQWPGQTREDERYVANIVQQVVRQRVASLYAKNPTVVGKRRNRMDFKIWDGKQKSLQAAMANPTAPYNTQLLLDVNAGKTQRDKLDRITKTLEICFNHDLKRQFPNFKRMMKQMIRRTETCGVGYLKLDFQRQLETRPEIEAQISDLTLQLSSIEALIAQKQDGEFNDDSAKAEALRISIKALQEQKYVVVREGMVYNFPRATSLIIDPSCTQLEGFLGTGWIAEKFKMPKEDVARIYKIDLCDITQATDQGRTITQPVAEKKKAENLCDVYEVHHKDTGTVFTIMRGYKKYLKEPSAPNVCLDGFFPYFALSFNDKEDEECIFPVSSVRNMRHIQMERNRSKEALRQHRIAKAPKYAGAGAGMSLDDKAKLEAAPPHHIVWFDSLQPGQKVADLFQEIATANIDPNIYETGSIMEDVNLVVGMQDAHLGGTSGATATESSIAEDSRMSSISSNVDDLDDFLCAVVKASGHIMLLELSPEIVQGIAGVGAAWPEFSAQEIKDDIYLEIEAGSSGRPNRAADAAAWSQIGPQLQMIPGVSPEWLARTLINIIDPNVSLEDAYIDGLPSIQAMNAAAAAPPVAPGTGAAGAAPTGDPTTDPNLMGPAGMTKAPAAQGGSGMMEQSRGLMPG